MKINQLDKIVQDWSKKRDIQAFSCLIQKEGNPIFEHCYGEIDSKGKKIEAKTLFSIGSVSKIFTTISTLILRDRGYLELDTPLYQYLPEFSMKDERYKKITVRMLLNHSAGFYGNACRGKYTLEVHRQYLQEVLDFMRQSDLKDEPGVMSVYCNDGFAMAELLIEKISGMSYSEFVQENILDPLRMRNTDFPEHECREGRIILAKSPFVLDYPQEVVNGIGSGGIYSTAHDLCCLLDAIMDEKLLSENSWQEMNRLQRAEGIVIEPKMSLQYGLGWDTVESDLFKCYGLTAMAKSGSTFGFNSYVMVCPSEKISAAIVMCSSNSKSSLLLKKLVKVILEELGYKKDIPVYPTEEFFVATELENGFYGNNDSIVDIKVESNLIEMNNLKGERTIFQLEKGGYTFYGEWKGKKNPTLYFKKEKGKTFLILETETHVVEGLKERIPYLEKIELEKGKDIFFPQELTLILDNEYPGQREFGTCPLLIKLYQKENMIFGYYPLKVVSETKAVPFIQLAGNNSREMVPLEKNGDDSLQWGQYHYLPLDKIKKIYTTSFEISQEKTHWFLGSDALDTVKMDGQGRCVMINYEGKLVYDSALSWEMPENLEELIIGFTGREGTKIEIGISEEE